MNTTAQRVCAFLAQPFTGPKTAERGYLLYISIDVRRELPKAITLCRGPWTAYCQSKLADLMFALELGRRSASASIPFVSNAAHPGYARTNLQTSGPGRQLHMAEYRSRKDKFVALWPHREVV